jgi:hypothetical protein
MSTQKIIYVTLIALLAVSLLIPALSTDVFVEGSKDAKVIKGEVELKVELDKWSVHIPITDTPNKVHLFGSLTQTFGDEANYPMWGKKYYIEVRGPEGYYLEPRLVDDRTDENGEFEFEFKIDKTALTGDYNVTVYAEGEQYSVEFSVLSGDYRAAVTSNLPDYITYRITFDDRWYRNVTGFEDYITEFKQGTHSISVPGFIKDPYYPNKVWVCKENTKKATGLQPSPATSYEYEVIDFEYEEQTLLPILFLPDLITAYYYTKDFGTNIIEWDAHNNCFTYGGSTDTFNLELDESIFVNDEEYKFTKWKFGSESYDGLSIVLPFEKVDARAESEMEPVSLEIYYKVWSPYDVDNRFLLVASAVGIGLIIVGWLFWKSPFNLKSWFRF